MVLTASKSCEGGPLPPLRHSSLTFGGRKVSPSLSRSSSSTTARVHFTFAMSGRGSTSGDSTSRAVWKLPGRRGRPTTLGRTLASPEDADAFASRESSKIFFLPGALRLPGFRDFMPTNPTVASRTSAASAMATPNFRLLRTLRKPPDSASAALEGSLFTRPPPVRPICSSASDASDSSPDASAAPTTLPLSWSNLSLGLAPFADRFLLAGAMALRPGEPSDGQNIRGSGASSPEFRQPWKPIGISWHRAGPASPWRRRASSRPADGTPLL
mmetsp:Transcript_32438/g.70599  ORF Transcript_32438/g.70599 Transcript_32438/m.70599 type:complete len:271 (+) Transcript_32438:1144-1956(+)